MEQLRAQYNEGTQVRSREAVGAGYQFRLELVKRRKEFEKCQAEICLNSGTDYSIVEVLL